MQTPYIYSTSRVNTLADFLLTKTDIDRLLVAEAGDDLQSALKETYLAPYLVHVPSEDVALAIEQTLIEAKRLIHRIAPNGNQFRVLWVQYDIHNLRVFAKATVKQLPFEACLPFVSERGIYDPAYLFAQAQENTLNRLQPEWQEAYEEASRLVAAGDIDQVDQLFDNVFFATVRRMAAAANDAFLRVYLRAVIDMFNLKSRLRTLSNSETSLAATFVSGGNFRLDEMESKEHVLSAFEKLDGSGFWRDAIEYFESTGNTTRIDARADDYLLSLAKQSSFDMFSSASLVLYYLKCRQAAANVRTIVVGKNSGMSEVDIRANLRIAYVND